MRLIAKGKHAIDFFKGNYSFISGKLYGIKIFYQNGSLNIDLSAELLYAPLENRRVLLKFGNVIEFSFLHKENYNFSIIESLKLLADERGFYISFDPFGDLSELSSEDEDFILSKTLDAYFLSPHSLP